MLLLYNVSWVIIIVSKANLTEGGFQFKNSSGGPPGETGEAKIHLNKLKFGSKVQLGAESFAPSWNKYWEHRRLVQ